MNWTACLEGKCFSIAEVLVLALGLTVSIYVLFFWRRRSKAATAAQDFVRKTIRDADPRLSLSSTALAAALRRREFSCKEVLELHIAQIEKLNPILNALVATRFEAARKEAAAADERLDRAAKGEEVDIPPLLGVPFITKEVHEYPGFPYTAGLVGRKGKVGKKKNIVLRRVEEAGAIVLGCGNVSEGCMWSESDNRVHGCSNNPHDITRTPGGSSGGNAAAVAALQGSFSVTSDVGGSTRIPALYNGLFGHKPSGGSIHNLRTIPTVHGEVERYCQLGPCCKSSVDLMPILRILAGAPEKHELHDGSEDELERHELQQQHLRVFDWPNPEEIDVKRLRYFVIWEQPGVELGLVSKRHDDMLKAQQTVVGQIEKEFAVKVEAVSFPAFRKCFDIWSIMLQTANAEHPFAGTISDGLSSQIWPVWELLKWILTGGLFSNHTLPALGLAAAEIIVQLTPKKNLQMLQLGAQLREELNNLLGEDGVLIFPALPCPAPKHGPLPNLLYFADYAACGIFNTLEMPATMIPIALSRKERLPVGVQLVAGNGNDHLTIAVAMALERLGVSQYVSPGM